MPAETMTRETLYLLPGLLCDATTFAAQQRALEADYDVRVFDFLGLDSMEAMAARVLDGAPERFSLVGFSMGARVALHLYARAPQRVARLCLMDTGVAPVAPGEPEKRQILVDLAAKEGVEALCRAWLPPMLNPARVDDSALVEPLRTMIRRTSPEIFAGQVRALLGREDARPVLATITCPTLVIVGEFDAWSPPAQHEDMARQIPGAEFVVVPDSGHFLPVEQPEATTAALRRWMARPATPHTAET